MIVLKERYLFLDALLAWRPRHVQDVESLLGRSLVVNVMQCDEDLRERLKPYAFRVRPFHTLLIDLSPPEDEIQAQFDRDCRRLLRRAAEIPHDVRVNRHQEEAYALIQRFIERKKFRAPLPRREWGALVDNADVFTLHYKERVVDCNVVIVDGRNRAHVVVGGMVDPDDPEAGDVISTIHRSMLWQVMLHYKAAGVQYFDFGGIEPDPESPLYPITRFKRKFGGEEICEYYLRVTKNPVLRSVLRVLHDTRLRLKKAA